MNAIVPLSRNTWKKLWFFGCFFLCASCTPSPHQPFPSKQDIEQLQQWTQLSTLQQDQLHTLFQEKLNARSKHTRRRAILALQDAPLLAKDFFPLFQKILENSSTDQPYLLQTLQRLGIEANLFIPQLQKLYANTVDEKLQLSLLQTLSAILLTEKERLELWLSAFHSESPTFVLAAIPHLEQFSPQMTIARETVLEKFKTVVSETLAKPLANLLLTLAPDPHYLRQAVENMPLCARYWISWVIIQREEKNKSGIPSLLQTLSQTEDPVLKRYLLLEIAHQRNEYYQNQVVPKLLPLTKDPEWLYGLAYTFRTIPDQQEKTLPFLLKHLAHSDPFVRSYLAETLAFLAKDSLPVFLALLTLLEEEKETQVRLVLLHLLKKNWKGKVLAYLPRREEAFLKCLQDPHFLVRFEAALALGRQREAFPPLLEGLNHSTFAIRLQAISALKRFSSEEKLAPLLLKLLEQETHPDIIHEASEILGKQASEPALEIFIQKLQQPDVENRLQALNALSFFGKQAQKAFPFLPFDDEDEMIRANCATFLGQLQIPSPEYLTPLVHLIQDPHPVVQLYAKRALKKIHPPKRMMLPLLGKTFFWHILFSFLTLLFLGGSTFFWGIRWFRKHPWQKPLKTILMNSPRVYVLMIIIVGTIISLVWLQRETGLCFKYPQEFSFEQTVEEFRGAWIFLALVIYDYIYGILAIGVLLFYSYLIWTNSQRVREGTSFPYHTLFGVVLRIFCAIWLGYTLIFLLLRIKVYLQTTPYGTVLQLIFNA